MEGRPGPKGPSCRGKHLGVFFLALDELSPALICGPGFTEWPPSEMHKSQVAGCESSGRPTGLYQLWWTSFFLLYSTQEALAAASAPPPPPSAKTHHPFKNCSRHSGGERFHACLGNMILLPSTAKRPEGLNLMGPITYLFDKYRREELEHRSVAPELREMTKARTGCPYPFRGTEEWKKLVSEKEMNRTVLTT